MSLIRKYDERGAGALLTGPMFSHYLANLALSEIDRDLGDFPCKIFRYVDDYVLIGSIEDVEQASDLLGAKLKADGLRLHAPESVKSMTITAKEWLSAEFDFTDSTLSNRWMKIVGGIKKLLILGKITRDDFAAEFIENGLRMPVLDYSAAVRESNAFEKIRQLGLWNWLFRRARGISCESIIRDTLEFSRIIEKEIVSILESGDRLSPFERKRAVTKLRYRLGRAMYVCSEEFLAALEAPLADWPELVLLGHVAKAIVTKNCDDVIDLGVNAAQSVAQVFRCSLDTAVFQRPVDTNLRRLGFMAMVLNGVSVQAGEVVQSDLTRFIGGTISAESFKNGEGFWRDLACLNGVGEPRFVDMMDTAFDLAQDVTFDAINVDYGYSI